MRKAFHCHGFQSPKLRGALPLWAREQAGPRATLGMLGIPEDADQQLQRELLDLAVQPLLPGAPAGPPVVQVGAGAEVSQVQLVLQLEALDPAGSRQVLSKRSARPARPRRRWPRRRRQGAGVAGQGHRAFRMFRIPIGNLGGIKKGPLERVHSTRQAGNASREAWSRCGVRPYL